LLLETIDGTNGFRIVGDPDPNGGRGRVSVAGDVNGDGVDDLIIGFISADPNGSMSGATFVVFGRLGGLLPDIHLGDLDGSDGFVLNGIAPNDESGYAVGGAGDLNSDGIADLIIGARFARERAGESYVVFGSMAGFPASFELADLLLANGGDGSAGFVLRGIDQDDWSGVSVSGAGDVNGDGTADVLIGALRADPNGASSGEAYVVFGSSENFPGELALSSLDGTNGFTLNGIDDEDYAGIAVSGAGDINGDGVDDLLINAAGVRPEIEAGDTYVVFGRGPTPLSLSILGADARVAVCRNLTDPQTVVADSPDVRPRDSWDCEALGVTVLPDHQVSMLVRGISVTPALQGSAGGVASGAAAWCRNDSSGATVQTPVAPDGSWNCVAAGLPVAHGDEVIVVVRGRAE
jgi:hypothetical protein